MNIYFLQEIKKAAEAAFEWVSIDSDSLMSLFIVIFSPPITLRMILLNIIPIVKKNLYL